MSHKTAAPSVPTVSLTPERFPRTVTQDNVVYSVVTAYPYLAESGRLLYFNGRFENHAGKTFRALVPSSANDDGTFIIGSTAHIKEKALPFGHESLVGLAQHARVLCLEGEGKTQVAHSRGFAAISFKRFSREHAHLLNGHDIVICRDNDDAGLKQANAFKELLGNGVIWNPCSDIEGGDFADLVRDLRDEGRDDEDVRCAINRCIAEAKSAAPCADGHLEKPLVLVRFG
jgi:hypothetical protein